MSKIVEKLLSLSVINFSIGFFIILLIPTLQLWGWGFWNYLDHVRINTIVANSITFSLISFILWRFRRFAGTNIQSYIIPTVSIVYFLVFTYFLFTRFGYSRYVLIGGYSLNILWFFLITYLLKERKKQHFLVIPHGKANNLISLKIFREFKLTVITEPKIKSQQVFHGIIVDLNASTLTKEWEKFIAKCTLEHIPVYHSKQIIEDITGRIQIEHLSENHFGTLLPSPFYSFGKRLLDLLIVFLSVPLTLPIMLIIAVLIKLESKGPILFIQDRVGQGNIDFKIFKFRSMFIDAEKEGAKLAQIDDHRITKIGRWIRKTRIDELPQLWNVLKGEMSFIGPRPEQRTFVTQFEECIPFYMYRLVLKPGMTGWAQVMQGYASNENDTILKIQYDFYYIKHFSFWLDILIVLKTIRVLVTGFGAK
ncbi:exopolysaccharide biosynthesis polyprenyl glycosylphosphotransferase [Acinetobacter beijerinckii]|uniref:exopolysaccharide biosynthesis polyprenyl glycosylphosphotransferase n=1 Tax=Acinetobacter beijerinckii TaxID=262668 RepID=UPI003AF80BE8